jgi:hypothetical protein
VVNTTGNPEGGEKNPATGTPRAGYTEPSDGGTGGPDSPAGGEPLGEYGYTGGYGYGPGYGDPDGGGDYSYGPGYGAPDAGHSGQDGPAYARPGDADAPGPPGHDGPGGQTGPAGGAVAYQPPQPVVGATPALKGFPGGPGIDTLTGDKDGPDAHGLSSPSVWQNAQRAWRDSGVEWQRPGSDYEQAEAEWERVQAAAPARRRNRPRLGGSGQPTGRLSGAALTGMSASVAGREGGLGRPAGGQTTPPRRSGGGTGAGRGVWVTALVVIVVAGLAVGGVELFGGKSNRPAATGPQYPPATPAGRILTTDPAQAGRNIFQSVTAVGESSGTVVAAGAESGQWLPRTQFLVSTNGGKTWRLGAIRATASVSSAAIPPQFIAHGPAGWLALGPGAYWTSQDGATWTQAAAAFPVQAGDQVAGVAATATGFVVVGDNVPKRDPGLRHPVVWTSANGQAWQRLSGSRLPLPAPGGRVLRIRGVAAHGSDVLIYGNALLPTQAGQGRHTHKVMSVRYALWRSGNGGSSWGLAHLPVGAGQADSIDGIAATGTGFVAIRPATSRSAGPDAVAFTSANGTTWTTGGTIAAAKPAHLDITTVSGSDQGVVAAGHESGGAHAVFVSTNGTSWQSLAGVGNASQTLSGLTVAAGGTVVAGGYGPLSPVDQFPYLALAAAGKPVTPVSFASIPGATGPSMGVTGLASAAGHQVAVGTANGYPAIWAGGGGRWAQVTSSGLTRPGLSTLTAVAHGPAGWVAVGGTITAAPVRPIVLGSTDGTSWQAADSESAFSAPGITLHAAAAGPGGYVVAGQETMPAATTTKTVGSGKHTKRVKRTVPAHTDAVAWWSSGLTGWTQVLNTAGPAPRVINAVTADGSGFVAVGSIGDQPAAWTSTDGKTWKLTQLGPPPGAAVAALHQVAVHGHLIVATGTSAGTKGVTSAFSEYSTDDGTLWQQEPLTAPASPTTATALTTTRKGIVAVGTSGPVGRQHVVVWWTTGGFSWKTIEPTGTGLTSPGSQAITALTASGSALTGSGYLVTGKGEEPTLWQATAGP